MTYVDVNGQGAVADNKWAPFQIWNFSVYILLTNTSSFCAAMASSHILSRVRWFIWHSDSTYLKYLHHYLESIFSDSIWKKGNVEGSRNCQDNSP